MLAAFAPAFFTFDNVRDLLLANVPVLIVAVGMTLVVLAAEIDISVGSQFAICSVAAGVLAISGVADIRRGALRTTLAGALLGALNGALVAWVQFPSIVVTLAAMVALRDGLRWATQGAWVQNLPPGFHLVFGLPAGRGSEWLTIAAAAAITSARRVGSAPSGGGQRAVYDYPAPIPPPARLAGINPQTIGLQRLHVLTGALTGFAAALNAVRFEQIPSNAGIGLELKVIAAVVVGGVSITGPDAAAMFSARCSALFVLGLIGPALTFLGFSAYWERAIEGGIILAAVSMDAVSAQWRRNADLAAAHRA